MSIPYSSSPLNRQRNKPVCRNTNIFYVLQNLLQNICLYSGCYHRLSLFFNPKQNDANDAIIAPKLQVLLCDMFVITYYKAVEVRLLVGRFHPFYRPRRPLR